MTGVWTETDFENFAKVGGGGGGETVDTSKFVLKENGEATNLTIHYAKNEDEKLNGKRTGTMTTDDLGGKLSKLNDDGSALADFQIYGSQTEKMEAGEIVDFVRQYKTLDLSDYVVKDGGTVENLTIKFRQTNDQNKDTIKRGVLRTDDLGNQVSKLNSYGNAKAGFEMWIDNTKKTSAEKINNQITELQNKTQHLNTDGNAKEEFGLIGYNHQSKTIKATLCSEIVPIVTLFSEKNISYTNSKNEIVNLGKYMEYDSPIYFPHDVRFKTTDKDGTEIFASFHVLQCIMKNLIDKMIEKEQYLMEKIKGLEPPQPKLLSNDDDENKELNFGEMTEEDLENYLQKDFETWKSSIDKLFENNDRISDIEENIEKIGNIFSADTTESQVYRNKEGFVINNQAQTLALNDEEEEKPVVLTFEEKLKKWQDEELDQLKWLNQGIKEIWSFCAGLSEDLSRLEENQCQCGGSGTVSDDKLTALERKCKNIETDLTFENLTTENRIKILEDKTKNIECDKYYDSIIQLLEEKCSTIE
ncbi:hypothetical protein M9Y10_001344 [Tritrichomonas musculus]|uniref:Uncharacterized protein n=1 Tax=Tritrichomonas musculus TaxID=1915356 RepID=A0ABR2L7T2_9EUKA